jgi:hypothetical protein
MSNNGCGQLGAIQTRGTCWFYSILNGFILSEDGQKILYNRLTNFYKKLKPAEKAYFDDQFNAPCPMKNLSKTKEIYFWKFIDQYLCFMSGPRATTLKAGKSASILGGMSLQGTVAKNMGGKGAYPQAEIGKILDHVGFAKEYYFKYATDPPKFHAARKPQFVVVMQNKYYPKSYMDEIPKGLLTDPKYEVMCASLVIANTNANKSETHKWHAIAGFVCNGKGYIYDSNQRKVFKCNWWNLAEFKKVANEEVGAHYSFFKGGQINVHLYAFSIFARKEFTKDIGSACLMKHKAVTPNLGLSNAFFTDPNSGKAINTRFPQLNPAQRVALKRKWARTEHRAAVYLNKATFNSILAGAKNIKNGMQQVTNLENAGYQLKYNDYYNFTNKLHAKFANKKASPAKTLTFANVKTRLNQFTKSTAAVRKHQYSLVWKGLPMTQRKMLMHWRNKGEWLANNAFENKAKPPIKRKSVAKPPGPSPRTARTTKLRSNFNTYWKGLTSNNRQVVRNYIAAYKSPSPLKPKSPSPTAKKLAPFFEPVKYTLANAKRNVNALKTAKARSEFYKKGTVGKGLNPSNLMELSKYIKAKNQAAKNARAAKKSVKK